MTADEEKYQRLIKYNKIMISLVGVICVIITAYVFIEMKEIIIPLVLAMIIYFMLNPGNDSRSPHRCFYKNYT